MNNQLQPRKLTIGLALLAVLMLASCGKKPEETASNTPDTPAANSSPASSTTTSNNSAVSAEAQKLGVQPEAETTCPSNAPIKGKITQKRGNIYHTTKSPDFAKVKPDICFKDTATAEKAGFTALK